MSRTTPEAKRAVQDLMVLPQNSTCADCHKRPTKWASSTLGVFICLECSGIHRSLGTHITFVRSCTLDGWTPEQVRVMRRVGNAEANGFWEARLPPDYSPPYFDRGQMEQFIRAKYAERRWAAGGDPPHLRDFAASAAPADGRANPGMYEGRFACNPQLQEHRVFGRQLAASRSAEPPRSGEPPRQAAHGALSLTDFMNLMRPAPPPEEEPADAFAFTTDSAGEQEASPFTFGSEEAEPAEPPSAEPVTPAPSEPASAEPAPPVEREEVRSPARVAQRPRPEAPPAGGSTAAEIMRMGAGHPAARGAKKQALFGKPKGVAAFKKRPEPQQAPAGPSALDQMLAFVHDSSFRPVSAPVEPGQFSLFAPAGKE
jgi:hypothetical protein